MTNEAGGGTHTQSENHPWTIEIPDHPKRKDSAEYVKARARMNALAKGIDGLFYGASPYQDHHGGGLWLKDDDGWFLVRNLAGIEWSAQFCADPKKVDQLRLNARRLYAKFPGVAEELGIADILSKPIETPEDVAAWTDSLANASMPLPEAAHVGIIPKANTGGVHHYPAPIVEIEFFKRDDFQLWVTDEEGQPAAVVPVEPLDSDDQCVQVVYATPGTRLASEKAAAEDDSRALILDGAHALAQQAFMFVPSAARARTEPQQ